ncbi:Alpha-1,2-Mannosidase [Aphelenchoides fujianensis]|nr:Alpha-1,2-Mannosidase [Aphelenchoides fujianensis]
MFMHAYKSYMQLAFPHDELRPLSCKPRIRGVTPSRGDVDDSLGNFSLTLIDSMDTLVVMGEYEEFERAVHAVVQRVRFDADFVVSVFETNIRMIGGLISGHLMSRLVQEKMPTRLQWYNGELLTMAAELADRLLPAFNTTSGIPHSRINLKHGLTADLKAQSDTCTACAGTIILEWAALSRLSGNPVYEEKARKAMDFLWNQRNHGSNLMGTVLNVNSGDWVRRDASVGAGIDSYLEYTLKTYILLGEPEYLQRFNTHYSSIQRYLNKGPLFIDVHMHRPLVASRSYMDSLLAFWPGVQVLKGDLKGAIEIHEMLHQVIKKHKFLPEAFTHDLQIHWPQHLMRPEFLESTYFLYRATKDPHYLEVAAQVMESTNEHCRTRCGFAAVKDIRTMELLDEMESFVLAETFKYLYLIFAEPSDLLFDPDNYVLTTEAHFLPLSIGEQQSPDALPRRLLIDPDEVIDDESSRKYESVCPNFASEFRTLNELSEFGSTIRSNVKKILTELSSLGSFAQLLSHTSGQSGAFSTDEIQHKASERLRAWAFSSSNPEHVKKLKEMGIQLRIMPDGKMQLTHQAESAASPLLAVHGLEFIKEMVELSQRMEKQPPAAMERLVQLVSEPLLGTVHFLASPAQFGPDLLDEEVVGEAAVAEPYNGCSEIVNTRRMAGRIGIVRRGECMFQEKIRHLQDAGAIAAIVIDNHPGTSADTSPLFAMSADQEDVGDIHIPALFLFHFEGQQLLSRVIGDHRVLLRLSFYLLSPQFLLNELLHDRCCWRAPLTLENDFFRLSADRRTFEIHLRVPAAGGDVRELAAEEFERISTGILLQTKEEVLQFRNLCTRLIETALRESADFSLDAAVADQLGRLLRSAHLQPPAVHLRPPTHSLVCRLEPTALRCRLLARRPLIAESPRVLEQTERDEL